MEEFTENNRKQQPDHYFKKGQSGNPKGRPKDSEETKLKRKATKEFIADYKKALGEALPLVSPVLVAKALEGDMQAIKELNDRVMGKSLQSTDITTDGKPINFILNSDLVDEVPQDTKNSS